MSSLIKTYFPQLTERQQQQYEALPALYAHWNEQINVISRKDQDNLMERHVLHSLGIAAVQPFAPGTEVLDLGTGGGFPGIPLAIMFPEVSFVLVDSIGKKIKVAQAVIDELKLVNVTAHHCRAEELSQQFEFVVTRAVAPLVTLAYWTKGKVHGNHFHDLKNGILALKGGDLTEELAEVKRKAKVFALNEHFKEEFFDTKMVVHLPLN